MHIHANLTTDSLSTVLFDNTFDTLVLAGNDWQAKGGALGLQDLTPTSFEVETQGVYVSPRIDPATGHANTNQQPCNITLAVSWDGGTPSAAVTIEDLSGTALQETGDETATHGYVQVGTQVHKVTPVAAPPG